MPEANVKIVQASKMKRVRNFITPSGQVIDGGPEEYYNNKTNKNGKPNMSGFKFK